MPTNTSLENISLENENTVQSYSEMGAREYDDPMNLEFLYGGVGRKNHHFGFRNRVLNF